MMDKRTITETSRKKRMVRQIYRRNRWSLTLVLLTSLVVLGCVTCTSPRRLKAVTELAPPSNVRLVSQADSTTIAWGPSPDEQRKGFAGYNVYYSQKSLIFTPVEKLPEPILVDKGTHRYTFKQLKESVEYFVHVRSRNRHGQLSLPSLPELEILRSANNP